MELAAAERFRCLDHALLTTQEQLDDAASKVSDILWRLNGAFHGEPSRGHGKVVGAWGRRTQLAYAEDVDLLFILPEATYHEFSGYQAKGQSDLLRELKAAIEPQYPQATIRDDGQAVVLAFDAVTVEVIPAAELAGGQLCICSNADAGRWNTIDPTAQVRAFDAADEESAGNARRLIRMIKAWKYAWEVTIKALPLELLAIEFMTNYGLRRSDYSHFHLFMRDFFRFMIGRAGSQVVMPGTLKAVMLGNAWAEAATLAYQASFKACEYERRDCKALAADEWQSIFCSLTDR